jgi:hypothetical protein
MVDICKKSHDWGLNIVIIQGMDTIRTILVTNKLGVQTKKLEVLICYDFHSGIFNDEEDVMFAIELDLFSIGTITISIYTKHVPKSICILDIVIAKLVPKQHVKPIGVLLIKVCIPPNTIKQHLKLSSINRLER